MALILLITRAVELGDTQVYGHDMVTYLGKSPFGKGNTLWEFGHVLWRPIGWALLSIASPLLSSVTDWTLVMQADFVLMVVSVLCSLLAVVLWHAIALRVTGSGPIASLVAIAAGCSHAVLLYGHSGCAYIPGLTALTASVYFLFERRTTAGAILFALSLLLWFPFVLSGAALLLLVAWPPSSWLAGKSLAGKSPAGNSPGKTFARPAVGECVRFLGVSGLLVLLVYGFAIWARDIHSVKEGLEWFGNANHGYEQTAKAVRMATGLPRSYLFLGKDGILFKRFLRHDPYSPVTVLDLAGASLWKLLLFYLFALSLLAEMLRRPRLGLLLPVVAAAVVPVIFFAAVLFESGSPERYLPFLPFVVLAVSWALRDFPAGRRPTQAVIALFLFCMIAIDLFSLSAPRVTAENAGALARLGNIRGRINSAGLVIVPTNQDQLVDTLNRLAFDPVNRPEPLRLHDLLEMGNTRLPVWRQSFGQDALKAWQNGGEVWIAKRFWSERPLPSWNWTEGDDPRISWKELPAFFSGIATDDDSGGPDGFRRLARNDANLTMLSKLANTPGKTTE